MSDNSINFGGSANFSGMTEATLRPTGDADVQKRIKGYRKEASGIITLVNLAGTDVTATHEIAPATKSKTGNARLTGDGVTAVALTWSAATDRPANGDITSVTVAPVIGHAVATGDTGTLTVPAGGQQSFSDLSESAFAVATEAIATADTVIQFTYVVYDSRI